MARKVLDEVKEIVEPGITTDELDSLKMGDAEAAKILAKVQVNRIDLEILEHRMKTLLESEDNQQLQSVKAIRLMLSSMDPPIDFIIK